MRQARLRWPVPENIDALLRQRKLLSIGRRAKYLLLNFSHGQLLLHLGMSGSLRLVDAGVAPAKHDHIDIEFAAGHCLRYTDPRRFGAMLWQPAGSGIHPLLARLGPEPLSEDFDGEHLYALARGRKAAIKTFIMDSTVVVGVGNIYANEALFAAGIRPDRIAGSLSRRRLQRLATEIVRILQQAIAQGGTTLRDFVGSDGRPGYFAQRLLVYGRGGQPCYRCQRPLVELRLGQRSAVYCRRCQR